mmetsp:Transcript_5002/g.13483  ORF Transcript_5002/g.13483 Transcript_5002/m.13483 type:complete len:141 (+) Transcript_5002:67-489(+)
MSECAFVSGAGPWASRVWGGRAAVCMMAEPKRSQSAGFKDESLPEIGVRGPGSRPKFDLRPKRFRAKEEQVCGMCSGSGETFCSICEGVANVRTDGTLLKCPKCGGTNVVSCGNCRGTGALPELVEGWEYKLDKMFKRQK